MIKEHFEKSYLLLPFSFHHNTSFFRFVSTFFSGHEFQESLCEVVLYIATIQKIAADPYRT